MAKPLQGALARLGGVRLTFGVADLADFASSCAARNGWGSGLDFAENPPRSCEVRGEKSRRFGLVSLLATLLLLKLGLSCTQDLYIYIYITLTSCCWCDRE